MGPTDKKLNIIKKYASLSVLKTLFIAGYRVQGIGDRVVNTGRMGYMEVSLELSGMYFALS